MSTEERLLSYLEANEVWFLKDRHGLAYTATEVAQAEHIPKEMFAKTVVVHSEDGYMMAVVPADRKVDLEELRLAFGSHRLRLATEHELFELFPDCELGAMPPFGNGTLFELPVYADGLLMAQEQITFNAGSHRDAVRMFTEDWGNLVKPTVLAFAHST
jgi:Ala-tRNA(Pro) deacylase